VNHPATIDAETGEYIEAGGTDADPAAWAALTNLAWRQSVEGIFKTGRLIIEAVEKIPHGQRMAYYDALVFSQQTANRLASIAASNRLSNYAHGRNLPASWRTLYELSKLTDSEFAAFDEAGLVTPSVERKQIEAFKAAIKKAERIEDVQRQALEIATASPRAPRGLFNVISIDPPWPYDNGNSAETYDPHGRRAANPYPEMSLEAIRELAVPAAEDCVLWLWTTHKFMRHSFYLLDAWGFADKAILTWAKDRMGLGRWLRSQSEFCIMAVRGSPVINLTNQTTVLHGPLREHSRKPDEFYALVDSLCVGRKLDYFSRQPRNGWQQFGNDTERFCE